MTDRFPLALIEQPLGDFDGSAVLKSSTPVCRRALAPQCYCICYSAKSTLGKPVFRDADHRYELSTRGAVQWAPKTEHQITPRTPRDG
jgi:hypothetical protein